MITRNMVGPMLAMISCLHLDAAESPIASFEVALPGPSASRSEQNPSPAEAGQSSKSAAPSATPIINPTQGLNIYVLVGERAVNSISAQSATAPVVEVRDDRNMPAPGAEVTVELPSRGASGVFAGGQRTWTGKTDASGQIVSAPFTPNQEPGSFTIRITAKHNGRTGLATVSQRNSLKSVAEGSTVDRRTFRNSRAWKIAAVAVAGGAAGGIVWATRRGSGKPTLVFQPGNVSFGGPR